MINLSIHLAICLPLVANNAASTQYLTDIKPDSVMCIWKAVYNKNAYAFIVFVVSEVEPIVRQNQTETNWFASTSS